VPLVRILHAKTLESAQIIPVAQFLEELLLNRPEPVAALRAKLALDMALEVILDSVVFQQRVVHIDEEHNLFGRFHFINFRHCPLDTRKFNRFKTSKLARWPLRCSTNHFLFERKREKMGRHGGHPSLETNKLTVMVPFLSSEQNAEGGAGDQE
jgi:hypothetical protein